MNSDITQKARDVLREGLGVAEDKIKPEARLVDDLRRRFAGHRRVNPAFEDKFDIVIPDEDAEKILTVKELMAYLRKKTKPQEEIIA